MLTIQLPNGKTAEFSVQSHLMLRTPKKTITVRPCDDNEKYKSVVTEIEVLSNGSIEQYQGKSEDTCLEKFVDILRKLERDFSPHKTWVEEGPSEATMDRW